MEKTKTFPLQVMLWPEIGVVSERELFFRFKGTASYSQASQYLTFMPGGAVDFSTAANVFNLEKWSKNCGLSDIGLSLRGKGRFELVIFQARAGRSWARLFNEVIDLEIDQPYEVDLTQRLQFTAPYGVLFFTLQALSEGEFHDFTWTSQQAPLRTPTLYLSITTFKREKAVQHSVARFREFMKSTPIAPHIHLMVVDNGRSAAIETTSDVTAFGNENLGGSGGFARGLEEAEARGASHCLFMDDDASVPMKAFERVWTFLAYAKDPKTAVAGGLSMGNHQWRLWENGAVFNRKCRPQGHGVDLRDQWSILQMEWESSYPPAQGYYGAWWFFAFPIAAVKHRPFPFFVRGDDVSFSLANDFNIVTLPGVICFQDLDFADKETAQTLYLDLRSHLAHHLAIPNMDIGMAKTLSIAMTFLLRSVMFMHYETARAESLAVEDAMAGPDFFDANADMKERRAFIGAMLKDEVWVPIKGDVPKERRLFDPRKNWLMRRVMQASLNGLFLPFFGLWGNHIVLRAEMRMNSTEFWGASRVTYISDDGTKMMQLRHSKAAALRESFRMARHLWKFYRRYAQIKADWSEGYKRLTTSAFWQGKFKTSQEPSSVPNPILEAIIASQPMEPVVEFLPAAAKPAPSSGAREKIHSLG